VSIAERRERDRAERHQLIIRIAREIAEAEGWDAVTTRRLAERIEYSQPVLYSHFAGKDAIVTAVALDGMTELTAAIDATRAAAGSPEQALAGMARAYCDFAAANPALYDAMFVLRTELPFAVDESPAQLKDAFAAVRAAVAPIAADRDPDVLTELTWSALHGLVTLARTHRIRPESHELRLALLTQTLLR
jgi:AcrR family transcriptional regulator